MSGNIRNIKIRLNLDRPEARRANEILNSQEKSMSRFVIDAVNAYGSSLDQEKAKERFLQAVNAALRETIQELFGAALVGNASVKVQEVPSQKPNSEKASAEIADDFLKNFI